MIRTLQGKKAIVISGVPGSGKTSTALLLSTVLGALYVNLSALSAVSCLLESYDRSRDTYIIREEPLVNLLDNIILNSRTPVIIDSHYGELVPSHHVAVVIVLRIHPEELLRRLLKSRRWWTLKKIAENVAAELMGSCTNNAITAYGHGKVCEVDVTGLTATEVTRKVMNIIKGVAPCVTNIDWLGHHISTEALEFIAKHS